MVMTKNDILFVSVLFATYKRIISSEYKSGKMNRGIYYSNLRRMTEVRDNLIHQ